MPPAVIWRSLRHSTSPVLWLPLFCYFMLSRRFGWRAPANYGSCRPVQLNSVSPESLSKEAQAATKPFVDVCEAAGLKRIGTFQSEYIGRKEGYSTILLHPNGYAYASVVWFKIGRGQHTKSKAVLSCHSQRVSGDYLETGSLAANEMHPELIPPGHNLLNVGVNMPPQEIIRAHFERIDSERGLIRFNADSVQHHLLRKSQTIFDYLVNKGFYVRLSESEIACLLTQARTRATGGDA